MKFVDAHIHLSDDEYAGHIDEVLAEAKASGVVAMVSNSMDLKTSMGSLRLASQHPGTVFAALGVHPSAVKSSREVEFGQVSELLLAQKGNEAIVAVGEIGLDSKYVTTIDEQMRVFDSMLHMAERLELPVVIHSRGTGSQIVAMLPSYNVRKVLLHWFSGPLNALEKGVESGYYFSEGPAAAYLNGIREVVKKVPVANLLSETDGPVRFFKAPFEGKRTTSAFIPMVIKAFAEIKNMGTEEVAAHVWKNFKEFYGSTLDI